MSISPRSFPDGLRKPDWTRKSKSWLLLTVAVAVALFSWWWVSRARQSSSEQEAAPTAVVTEEVTPEPPTATLIAVGDIMPSRVVGQKMIQKGFDYPFLQLRDYLQKGDIVFGNLESPIIEGESVSTGTMVFRSDPEVVAALKEAGFTVLSLANNHSMNKGSAGMIRTLALLGEAGIAVSGGGSDLASARAPAILEVNGLKVGFLAYTDTDVVPATYAATTTKPGTVFMDEAALLEDIEALRPAVDFVIISMHSGTEYVVEPNSRQTAFARAAADAGADLVIGTHPHVVQRAEQYSNIPIFYSLGNFVFDQMWSQETREGLVVKFRLTRGAPAEVLELVPVQINDYAQPHIITDEVQRSAIIERLGGQKAD